MPPGVKITFEKYVVKFKGKLFVNVSSLSSSSIYRSDIRREKILCFEVFAKSFSRQGRRRTIQQPPPLSEHDDDAGEDDGDNVGEHNDDKGLFINDVITFGGYSDPLPPQFQYQFLTFIS